ncbi:MAG: hypothetical protein ACOYNL_02760 [Rickettsiales bacterium]
MRPEQPSHIMPELIRYLANYRDQSTDAEILGVLSDHYFTILDTFSNIFAKPFQGKENLPLTPIRVVHYINEGKRAAGLEISLMLANADRAHPDNALLKDFYDQFADQMAQRILGSALGGGKKR